jgi:hypothetical protein
MSDSPDLTTDVAQCQGPGSQSVNRDYRYGNGNNTDDNLDLDAILAFNHTPDGDENDGRENSGDTIPAHQGQ